jgi:hypothetical protein
VNDRSRKLSFAFLALGVVTPFVTGWVVARQSHAYTATFGAPPEGMGLFASIATGTLITLGFFIAAAVGALRSISRLPRPRTLSRTIEVAVLCIPPFVVVLFILFGLLGVGSAPPEVIHTG